MEQMARGSQQVNRGVEDLRRGQYRASPARIARAGILDPRPRPGSLRTFLIVDSRRWWGFPSLERSRRWRPEAAYRTDMRTDECLLFQPKASGTPVGRLTASRHPVPVPFSVSSAGAAFEVVMADESTDSTVQAARGVRGRVLHIASGGGSSPRWR